MRFRIESVGVGLVVAAVAPYVALKLSWLAGSSVGVRDAAGLTELHSTRMVVGNNVTIALELAAVGLALALTSAWGRRVPAWIMLGLGAGATGLLAPILLGLPVGSVFQLATQGHLHTDGMEHMSPWVFATVYGGFAVLAMAIAVLAWRYAVVRWSTVLRRPPRAPGAWVLVLGALGLLPFAAAMLWWALVGPGTSGPAAMDAVVQRTILGVTGLLAAGGFLAPLVPWGSTRRPGLAWPLTWVGCTTAALQAPTQILLANGGQPSLATACLGVLAVPGAAVYGLQVLRRRLHEIGAPVPVGTAA